MKPVKIVAAVLLFSSSGLAQSGFDDWLSDRISTKIGTRKKTQTETVSLSRGSTTFVDQTSAADLLSTALNFVPVGRTTENSSGAGSVTASLYSIYALGTGQDPLRPSVYTKGALLRQFSFTVAREEQKDTPAGSQAGTLAGARVLLLNQREASVLAKDAELEKKLATVRAAYGIGSAATRREFGDFLFQRLRERTGVNDEFDFGRRYFDTKATIDEAIGMLTPADRAEFEALIDGQMRRSVNALKELNAIVEALQRRPQVAVDFQTIHRPGTSIDLYRTQLIFDAGFPNNWFVTLNGSFDYSNSQQVGADQRGARAAGEIRRDIASLGGASLRSPLQFGVSGEGLHANSGWKYRTQVRLMVPIAAGVNLPVSLGYGSSQDLLRKQEKDVYGKFGLTFDFAKVVAALRGI